ncbi:MAG: helix-turn-helix transcriptional regulator [Clostridia bacterium]|nr:helix-turn-helix transcriptional regulator [Clostridia bacterium]
MFDVKKFGSHLSILRKNSGMTQSELAEKLNVTRQSVSQYERGESFPDISVLLLLGEFFNISIDNLLFESPTNKAQNVLNELMREGIDITNAFLLIEYLNGIKDIQISKDELLSRILPLLDNKSKNKIFQKILDGEIEWTFLRSLLPYAEYIISTIEAAVMEGALPEDALEIVREYVFSK